MKVIDLVNKIAKGEECKAKIKFKLGDVIIDFYGWDNYYNTPEYKIEYIDKGCTTHDISFGTLIKSLNDEIELIEEPKEVELPKEYKIPEIESADNERILQAEIKINEIISYLKSKEEGKEK